MLNIPGTIEGVVIDVRSQDKYCPSEKTKERIEKLGLERLQKDTEGMSGAKLLKELENVVWQSADKVKNKALGYKNDDYIKALNFLEIFSFFCAQAQWSREALDGKLLVTTLIDVNGNPLKVERSLSSEVAVSNENKRVMKVVREIETLNNLLNSDMKHDKKVLKKHVERINALIDKIFVNNLSVSEQKAFSKIVDKAQKVIKHMA